MIIGNHDRHTIEDHKTMEYFASLDKMLRIVDNDRIVSLCHFPAEERISVIEDVANKQNICLKISAIVLEV